MVYLLMLEQVASLITSVAVSNPDFVSTVFLTLVDLFGAFG